MPDNAGWFEHTQMVVMLPTKYELSQKITQHKKSACVITLIQTNLFLSYPGRLLSPAQIGNSSKAD